MSSRDPLEARRQRSLTASLLDEEPLGDLLPYTGTTSDEKPPASSTRTGAAVSITARLLGEAPPIAADATAVATPPVRPAPDIADERTRRLAEAGGVELPSAPPPPARTPDVPRLKVRAESADVTAVHPHSPMPPRSRSPSRIGADPNAPGGMQVARAREAERTATQRAYEAIPQEVRVVGRAAKGVADAVTLGHAEELADVANRGIAKAAGVEPPRRSLSEMLLDVHPSTAEELAQAAGFIWGAGSLIAAQNRLAAGAAARLGLAHDVPPAVVGALEGAGYDLGYKADSPGERIRNVALGAGLGAAAGRIPSRPHAELPGRPELPDRPRSERLDVGEAAPDAPDAFARTRDGGLDFGEIDRAMARHIRRESAPIRMTHDAARKVWSAHGEELKQFGYGSPEDFVEDVARGYTEVREARGSRLMLIRPNGHDRILIVRLDPGGADDAFYGVRTGFVARPGYAERERLLGGSARIDPAGAGPSGDLPTLTRSTGEAGDQTVRGGGRTDTQQPPNDRKPPRSDQGAAEPALLRTAAGAGLGAGAGAAVDDEDRLRGAAIGAVAGGAAGAAAGPALRRARALGREGEAGAREATDAPSAERLPAELLQRAERAASGAADVDPDEYVNVAKFALDPAGETRLREEVARVIQEQGLAPKERITHARTQRIARRIERELGLDPEALRTDGRLSGPEMLAVRNLVNRNIGELDRLARIAVDGSQSAEAATHAQRMINALEAQNEGLLSRFIRARSQTGRDLNNLKILAHSSLEPVVWHAKAARLLGETRLPEGVRTEINRLIHAGDRKGLVRYVSGLRKASAGEKAVTLWKAGLLTGPPTHFANIIGNTTMAALETAKDAPATVLDALFSLATGQRTKAFNPKGAIFASIQGAKQGVKEAAEVMRGVPLDDALRKADYFREVNFDNAFLDGYTKFVFRSLGAEDRIFRGAALRRSLDEQARVLARAEGLRGGAFSRRVEQLLGDPTDEMALRAIDAAEIATFTNPGRLGRAARGAKRHLGPAADVVMPFTMTPANVATRVLEYSPLGALSTLPDIGRVFSRAMRGQPDAALQRQVVERLGRSATGTAPIAAGFLLAQHGLMTSGYPTDSRTRGEWQLTGKQENSVLVNGKWRSVERLSPLGNLMVFGAHLYHMLDEQGLTPTERAAGALAGLGKTLKEQSFLTGVESALGALDDPTHTGGTYLSRTIGSVVPNIVSRVARGMDPTMRAAEGPLEQIESRLPGLSMRLPAKLDALGEQRQRERGYATNLFDPFYSSSDGTMQDPVRHELARVGAGITGRRPKPHETSEEYQGRLRIEGAVLRAAIEQLVGSREYQAQPQLAERALGGRLKPEAVRDAAREQQRLMIEEVVARTRAHLTRDYAEIMKAVRSASQQPEPAGSVQ